MKAAVTGEMLATQIIDEFGNGAKTFFNAVQVRATNHVDSSEIEKASLIPNKQQERLQATT